LAGCDLGDLLVNSDLRKHKRFKTEGDIFAAFVMPNEPIIVGRILDLSHGGAGVQYLATTKLAIGPISIKIFGMGSHHMERVQSTVIYDMEIPEESWSIPAVRRCGIKFGRFASGAKTKWKGLMEPHLGGKLAAVCHRVSAPVKKVAEITS
jgi:hypothetical protein